MGFVPRNWSKYKNQAWTVCPPRGNGLLAYIFPREYLSPDISYIYLLYLYVSRYAGMRWEFVSDYVGLVGCVIVGTMASSEAQYCPCDSHVDVSVLVPIPDGQSRQILLSAQAWTGAFLRAHAHVMVCHWCHMTGWGVSHLWALASMWGCALGVWCRVGVWDCLAPHSASDAV